MQGIYGPTKTYDTCLCVYRVSPNREKQIPWSVCGITVNKNYRLIRLCYGLLLMRNLSQRISQISRRIYLNESRMIVSETPRVYVSSNYFEGIHAQAPTFQIRVRHDITDDCKRQWRHAIIPNFSNYRFIPHRLRATGERRSKENKPGE